MGSTPRSGKRNTLTWGRLAAMCAVAGLWVFLMTWRLESRTLHVDEFLTFYRTQPGSQRPDPMHPLTYYMYVSAWTRVFGSSDAALRLASLPPAAVAVGCVAVVAWWLLPWPGPLVAMAMVCLSTELLLYWRMARYFAASAGAFGLIMVGAVGYLRQRSGGWLAVMAAGTVACVYADYLPTVSAAVPWSWVILREGRQSRRRMAGVVAVLVLCGVVAVPAATWAVRGARKVGTSVPRLDPPRIAVLKLGLAGWSLLASEVVPPWQVRVALPMVVAGGALVALGLRRAFREKGEWLVIAAVWPAGVAIAWVALCAHPGEPPVRIPSLALHALPWMLLLAAGGWAWARSRGWASVALVVFLVGHVVGLVNYFALRNHLNPQYALDWRRVASFIEERLKAGDRIVTVYDGGFYRYLRVPFEHEEAVTLRRGGWQRLREALESGHTVWFVTRDRGSGEARRLAGEVRKHLREAGGQEIIHEFFPYGRAERRWREAFGPYRPANAYVTVIESRSPGRVGPGEEGKADE